MNTTAAKHIITVANGILKYYAGWVGKIHGESSNVVSDGLLGGYDTYHNFTQLEPIGVVGLIIPWNGPFFVAMLKVAPALAAGCSAVLKPAEETPLTALKLEEIFREAGLPDGVLNVITGYGDTTGAALTAHPDVDKISFTGSTEVGKLIVKAAAGNLKRLTLELGGKSPLIIFDDADLEKAIMLGGMGLLAGSGQNCCCTSRIYVQRGIYDQVVEGLVGLAQMIPMGGSEEPELGHRAADQREAAPTRARHRERRRGRRRAGDDRRQADGPQGLLLRGDDHDQHHARHAAHPRGDLRPVGSRDPVRRRGGGARRRERHRVRARRRLWTENLGRAHRMANELRAGQIWVNCAIATDPSMPICGHKQSGWGGERGRKGIEEYFNTKAVYIGLARPRSGRRGGYR